MDTTTTRGMLGLAYRRKAAGMTQEELAAALGVTRAALAMWETFRAWPSAGLLPKLADLLLCSIDDLYRAPTEEQLAELAGDELHVSPAADAQENYIPEEGVSP